MWTTKGMEESVMWDEQRAFRSIAMRMNYLALDRPDLQWAVRRCAKKTSPPSKDDDDRLKRIARYLKREPKESSKVYIRDEGR